MISLPYLLQLIGLATLAVLGYGLRTFIYTFFVHRSTLPRYLLPNGKSYALITGASDGIGLALSEEILARGFNVIIHGRNGSKLEGVRAKFQAKFPKLDVVVAEATALEPAASAKKVLQIVQEVEKKGGKLTVLVNNVGGLPPISTGKQFNELSEQSLQDTQDTIDMNATFPIMLTQQLLPTLTANQPSLILTLGSFAGVYGSPYIVTYGATKAFDHLFSISLAQELRLNKATKDVEVLALHVAEVESAGNPVQVNFARLSRHEAAKSALNRVGCEKDIVVIDWRHAVTAGVLAWFPTSVAGYVIGSNVAAKRFAERKST